jgi:hypothetical protein
MKFTFKFKLEMVEKSELTSLDYSEQKQVERAAK